MSDMLRRRAAFWRNMEYNLDHLVDDVRSQIGGKWACKADTDKFMELAKYLGEALCATRLRLSDVLLNQVDDWKGQYDDTKKTA